MYSELLKYFFVSSIFHTLFLQYERQKKAKGAASDSDSSRIKTPCAKNFERGSSGNLLFQVRLTSLGQKFQKR